MTSLHKLLKAKSGIRLDIGCGGNKEPGFVGMDNRPLDGVDIVHDIEKFPWPLLDESVLVALAKHVVEHIDPHGGVFMRFMDEVWRILKPEGEFGIITPYAGSHGYFQDPTHCNPCNETTFAYFDPEETKTGGVLWGIYKPKPWAIKPNSLVLQKEGILQVVLIKRANSSKYYENKVTS